MLLKFEFEMFINKIQQFFFFCEVLTTHRGWGNSRVHLARGQRVSRVSVSNSEIHPIVWKFCCGCRRVPRNWDTKKKKKIEFQLIFIFYFILSTCCFWHFVKHMSRIKVLMNSVWLVSWSISGSIRFQLICGRRRVNVILLSNILCCQLQ